MKILHFLQSNSFSGAENVVCQIIGLLKDEPNIEFVYCSPDGPIKDALQERGISFHPIHGFSKNELKKAIEIEKPDIIHAHDMRASFIASLACGHTKLISHVHNNNFDSRGLTVKSFAYLIPAFKASHIFYVSNSSYNGYCFHGYFKSKSSVLYNIIDTKLTQEKMQKDDTQYNYDVTFIGRLTYQKNPLRLMNIFKKCVEINKNIKIAVVGTGDLELETKAACQKLSIEKNVTFTGFMSNPLKILHDSKVMVMSSRWEGTPMCALEAMALGVPIVSTPVDGLKDLVAQGQTGFLSDNDDELSTYIIKIVENKGLQYALKKNTLELSKSINDKEKYRSKILESYYE